METIYYWRVDCYKQHEKIKWVRFDIKNAKIVVELDANYVVKIISKVSDNLSEINNLI